MENLLVEAMNMLIHLKNNLDQLRTAFLHFNNQGRTHITYFELVSFLKNRYGTIVDFSVCRRVDAEDYLKLRLGPIFQFPGEPLSWIVVPFNPQTDPPTGTLPLRVINKIESLQRLQTSLGSAAMGICMTHPDAIKLITQGMVFLVDYFCNEECFYLTHIPSRDEVRNENCCDLESRNASQRRRETTQGDFLPDCRRTTSYNIFKNINEIELEKIVSIINMEIEPLKTFFKKLIEHEIYIIDRPYEWRPRDIQFYVVKKKIRQSRQSTFLTASKSSSESSTSDQEDRVENTNSWIKPVSVLNWVERKMPSTRTGIRALKREHGLQCECCQSLMERTRTKILLILGHHVLGISSSNLYKEYKSFYGEDLRQVHVRFQHPLGMLRVLGLMALVTLRPFKYGGDCYIMIPRGRLQNMRFTKQLQGGMNFLEYMQYGETISTIAIANTLPAGTIFVGNVEKFYSINDFFITLPASLYNHRFNQIMMQMNADDGACTLEEMFPQNMRDNLICCVYTRGSWRRAWITHVTNINDHVVELYSIDDGVTEICQRTNIKPLRRQWADVPAQAIPCRMRCECPLARSQPSYLDPNIADFEKTLIEWRTLFMYSVAVDQSQLIPVVEVMFLHGMGKPAAYSHFENGQATCQHERCYYHLWLSWNAIWGLN